MKNFFIYKKIFSFLLIFNTFNTAFSQVSSVQFYPEVDSLADPVVYLGAQQMLVLEFDELEADSRTLYYTLAHCSIDGTPSDIIEQDYIDGFNRFYDAFDYELSFNTTTQYVHYRVYVDTSPLKISGNYRVDVFDEADNLIVSRPFWVSEQKVGLRSRVSRNRVVEPQTQELSLEVVCSQIESNNPVAEFRVVVRQNGNFYDQRLLEEPTFVRNGELTYDNIEFVAGNEGRWADNRSIKYPGTNIERIGFHDPFYHHTIRMDARPKNYSFHEDFNQRRYIAAYDIHEDADFAADYSFVHFTYFAGKNLGNVYVFGELTDWQIADRYKMTYDPLTGIYSSTLRLKQGLHGYKYVGGDGDLENSFAETENDYHIFVYYKPVGGDYFRLIGYKLHNSKSTVNDFIK